MPPELVDVLTQAAKQLGSTADRLWPQIVYITFITSLFWLIENWVASIILTILGIVVAQKIDDGAKTLHQRAQEKDDHSSEFFKPYSLVMTRWITWTAISVVLFFVWMIAVSSTPTNLAGIFFPETKTAVDLRKSVTGK